jgi:hypothetical protein
MSIDTRYMKPNGEVKVADPVRLQAFVNHLALGQVHSAVAIAERQGNDSGGNDISPVYLRLLRQLSSQSHDGLELDEWSQHEPRLHPDFQLIPSAIAPTAPLYVRHVHRVLAALDTDVDATSETGEEKLSETVDAIQILEEAIYRVASIVAYAAAKNDAALQPSSPSGSHLGATNRSSRGLSPSSRASGSSRFSPICANGFTAVYGEFVRRASFLLDLVPGIDDTGETPKERNGSVNKPALPFARVCSLFNWIAAACQCSLDPDNSTVIADRLCLRGDVGDLNSTLHEMQPWILAMRSLWRTICSMYTITYDSSKVTKTAVTAAVSCSLQAYAFAKIFLSGERSGTDTVSSISTTISATLASRAGYGIARGCSDASTPPHGDSISRLALKLAEDRCWATLDVLLRHAFMHTASALVSVLKPSDESESADAPRLADIPRRFLANEGEAAWRAIINWAVAALSADVAATSAYGSPNPKLNVGSPSAAPKDAPQPKSAWSWVDPTQPTLIPVILSLSVVHSLCDAAEERASVRRLHRSLAANSFARSNESAVQLTDSPSSFSRAADAPNAVMLAQEEVLRFLSLPAFVSLRPVVAAQCYLGGPDCPTTHRFLSATATSWTSGDHARFIRSLLGAEGSNAAGSGISPIHGPAAAGTGRLSPAKSFRDSPSLTRRESYVKQSPGHAPLAAGGANNSQQSTNGSGSAEYTKHHLLACVSLFEELWSLFIAADSLRSPMSGDDDAHSRSTLLPAMLNSPLNGAGSMDTDIIALEEQQRLSFLMGLIESGADVFVHATFDNATKLERALRQLLEANNALYRSSEFAAISLRPQLAALQTLTALRLQAASLGVNALMLSQRSKRTRLAARPIHDTEEHTYSDAMNKLFRTLSRLRRDNPDACAKAATQALWHLSQGVLHGALLGPGDGAGRKGDLQPRKLAGFIAERIRSIRSDIAEATQHFVLSNVDAVLDHLLIRLDLVSTFEDTAIAAGYSACEYWGGYFTLGRSATVDTTFRDDDPSVAVISFLTRPASWLLHRAAELRSTELVRRLLTQLFVVREGAIDFGPDGETTHVVTTMETAFAELNAELCWSKDMLIDAPNEGARSILGVDTIFHAQPNVKLSSATKDIMFLNAQHSPSPLSALSDRVASLPHYANNDVSVGDLLTELGGAPQLSQFSESGAALRLWQQLTWRTRDAMLAAPFDRDVAAVLHDEVENGYRRLRATNNGSEGQMPPNRLGQLLQSVLSHNATHRVLGGDACDALQRSGLELALHGWRETVRLLSIPAARIADLTSALRTGAVSMSTFHAGEAFTQCVNVFREAYASCASGPRVPIPNTVLLTNMYELMLRATSEFSVLCPDSDSTWNHCEGVIVCCALALAPRQLMLDHRASAFEGAPESTETLFDLVQTWLDRVPRDVSSPVARVVGEYKRLHEAYQNLWRLERRLTVALQTAIRENTQTHIDPVRCITSSDYGVKAVILPRLHSALDEVLTDSVQQQFVACIVVDFLRSLLLYLSDRELMAAASVALRSTVDAPERRAAVRDAALALLYAVRDAKLLAPLLLPLPSATPAQQASRLALVAVAAYERRRELLCNLRASDSSPLINNMIAAELRRVEDAERLLRDTTIVGISLPSPIPFVTWTSGDVKRIHQALVEARAFESAFLLVELVQEHCDASVADETRSTDLAVTTHFAKAAKEHTRLRAENAPSNRAELAVLRSVADVALREFGAGTTPAHDTFQKDPAKSMTWRLVAAITANRDNILPADTAAPIAFRVLRFVLESPLTSRHFHGHALWRRLALGSAVIASFSSPKLPPEARRRLIDMFPLHAFAAHPQLIVENLIRFGRLDDVAHIMAEAPDLHCDEMLVEYATIALDVDPLIDTAGLLVDRNTNAALHGPSSDEYHEFDTALHDFASCDATMVRDFDRQHMIVASSTAAGYDAAGLRQKFRYEGTPNRSFAEACFRLCRDKQFAAEAVSQYCRALFDTFVQLHDTTLVVPLLANLGEKLCLMAVDLVCPASHTRPSSKTPAQRTTASSVVVPPPPPLPTYVAAVMDQLRNLRQLFLLAVKLPLCGEGLFRTVDAFDDPQRMRDVINELRDRCDRGVAPAGRSIAMEVARACARSGGSEARQVQQQYVETLIDLGHLEMVSQIISELDEETRRVLLPRFIGYLEHRPAVVAYQCVFPAGAIDNPSSSSVSTITEADVPAILDQRRAMIRDLLDKYGSMADLCAFALRCGNVPHAVRHALQRQATPEQFYQCVVEACRHLGPASIRSLRSTILQQDPTLLNTSKHIDFICNELSTMGRLEDLYEWCSWGKDYGAAAAAALTIANGGATENERTVPLSGRSGRSGGVTSGALDADLSQSRSVASGGGNAGGVGSASFETRLRQRQPPQLEKRLQWINNSLKELNAALEMGDSRAFDGNSVDCTATPSAAAARSTAVDQHLLRRVQLATRCERDLLVEAGQRLKMPEVALARMSVFDPLPVDRAGRGGPASVDAFAVHLPASSAVNAIETLLMQGHVASASTALMIARDLDVSVASVCHDVVRKASDSKKIGVIQAVIQALERALLTAEETNAVYAEVVRVYATVHNMQAEAEKLVDTAFGTEPCRHRIAALIYVNRPQEALNAATRFRDEADRAEALREVISLTKKAAGGKIKIGKVDVKSMSSVNTQAQNRLDQLSQQQA